MNACQENISDPDVDLAFWGSETYRARPHWVTPQLEAMRHENQVRFANSFCQRLEEMCERIDPLVYGKMGPMPITTLNSLQACDGKSFNAAIKRLMTEAGGDYDQCLSAFDALFNKGLVDFGCPRGARETMVLLTAAGQEQLFFERTRVSRKAAHDALAAMDAEE